MAAGDGVSKAAFAAAIFKRGQKAELFEDGGADDEEEELAGKLGELHAVWSLERSGRDLAAAIWRPAQGLAEVVLQRGKLLAHMGFTRGAKLFLFPEEALYLLDRANLLLFLDPGRGAEKRLLSLQEAQDLLAGCGVGLDRYFVFAKLLRAGYIVQRHPSRWMLRPGEDPAAVWGAWGQQQQQEQQQDVGQGPAAPAAQQQQQQQQQAPPAVPATLQAGPPAKRRRTEGQQPKQHGSRWWAAPEPPVAAAAQQQEQQQQQQQEGDTQVQPAGPCLGLPWLAGCLPPGFLEALPRCAVALDAQQRARADFPRMAPLAAIPLPDLLPLGGPSSGRHLLHYDVFAANAKFSRKAPGPPAYVASVLPCSHMPTPEDAAAADAAAGGSPVRFCTIEKGDICFYGVTHVELRSILQ